MSLQQKIEDLYRDWIHPKSGVFTRAEAWRELGADIRTALIDAARVSSEDSPDTDLEAAAYGMFVRADERLTDQGDKDIRRYADNGAMPLDIERLEALVALGGGDRVKFGDMGIDEYRRADELRYSNVRAVMAAYDDWRRACSPYLPYLDRGLRVREADQLLGEADEPGDVAA